MTSIAPTTDLAGTIDLPPLSEETFDETTRLVYEHKPTGTITIAKHGKLVDSRSLHVAGTPVRYGVLDDGATFPIGDLACSVDWCAGHPADEADTWGELTHSTPERIVAGSGYRARVSTVEDRRGVRVNVSIDCDADFGDSELVALFGALADTHRAIADAGVFAEQLRAARLDQGAL